MNQQFVLDIVSSCLKDFRSWIFKTEINFGDIFENKAQSDHKKILITMKLAVDYILKINNYPKPTSVKTKCKKNPMITTSYVCKIWYSQCPIPLMCTPSSEDCLTDYVAKLGPAPDEDCSYSRMKLVCITIAFQ